MSNIKNLRLGYLHVPKSAGASLSKNIFQALGLLHVHIVKVAPRSTLPGELRDPSRSLIEGTIAFRLACNMPYVSGHVTYSELKTLQRNFIFTSLRDPRKRLISFFSYALSRANSERVLRTYPKLKQYAGMGFYDFLGHRKPENEISNFIIGDIVELELIKQRASWENEGNRFIAVIENALKRLDVIYACTNQEMLDDLCRRGFIPQTEALWINKSKDNVDFGALGTKREFLAAIDRMTWLDKQIYLTAQKLFPKTMSVPLASDDEILSEVEQRFGVSFSD